MTDHRSLRMHKEARRISEKEWIETLIKKAGVAVVCFHDSPYPYSTAMNYGYEWPEQLTFYFHMGKEGHRVNLLREDNKVSLNIYEFLDRRGYHPYKKETHDYRSVHAYGTAEIIEPEQEEEFLHGMSLMLVNNQRPAVRKMTRAMREKLYVLKITVDYVTAKAQYPVETSAEVQMPDNF